MESALRHSFFKIALTTLLVIGFGGEFCAAAPKATSHSEALTSAVELKAKNQNRIRDIDNEIRDILNANQKETAASAQLARTEKDMERLMELRREHLLRQEFLDRLTFQIDSHFQGGDLREFIRQKVVEMTQVDAREPRPSQIWRFLTYLSIALKDIPERNENVIGFIEDYMATSTLQNPLKPSDYLARRNYSNGAASQEGKPIPLDQLGDMVEDRVKNADMERQKSLEFEKRKPVIKGVSEEPQGAEPVKEPTAKTSQSPLPLSDKVLPPPQPKPQLGKSAPPVGL